MNYPQTFESNKDDFDRASKKLKTDMPNLGDSYTNLFISENQGDSTQKNANPTNYDPGFFIPPENSVVSDNQQPSQSYHFQQGYPPTNYTYQDFHIQNPGVNPKLLFNQNEQIPLMENTGTTVPLQEHDPSAPWKSENMYKDLKGAYYSQTGENPKYEDIKINNLFSPKSGGSVVDGDSIKMESSDLFDKGMMIEDTEKTLEEIYIFSEKASSQIAFFYKETKQKVQRDYFSEMKQKIKTCEDMIHNLMRTKILHVKNIYFAYYMLQQLHIYSTKLSLIENEIDLANKKNLKDHAERLAYLLFTDQPLSQSFKNKNRARQVNTKKKNHCTMKARIFTSPSSVFNMKGNISAYLVSKKDPSDKHSISLETEIKKISNSETEIIFSFRFPVGTRCQPSHVYLEMDGSMALPNATKANIKLRSESSNCFVVATNECQWEKAEGKLLLLDLFGETNNQKSSKKKRKNVKEEITEWAFFINHLAIRFIRSTRQEFCLNQIIPKLQNQHEEPIFKRPFGEMDITYLHLNRFNKALQVTSTQVNEFWDWYGKTLHIYRHNSHIRSIFIDGLLFSLISKENAASILEGQKPGTFLIRVSERSPKGEFALAYVDVDNKVKHSKIEPQRIQPPHSSLPNYIQDKERLNYLVKPPIVGTQNLMILSKDEAFGQYYNKKGKDKDDSYEEMD